MAAAAPANGTTPVDDALPLPAPVEEATPLVIVAEAVVFTTTVVGELETTKLDEDSRVERASDVVASTTVDEATVVVATALDEAALDSIDEEAEVSAVVDAGTEVDAGAVEAGAVVEGEAASEEEIWAQISPVTVSAVVASVREQPLRTQLSAAFVTACWLWHMQAKSVALQVVT